MAPDRCARKPPIGGDVLRGQGCSPGRLLATCRDLAGGLRGCAYMVQTAYDPARLTCGAGFEPATAATSLFERKTSSLSMMATKQ
jgi:hypothetical protein